MVTSSPSGGGTHGLLAPSKHGNDLGRGWAMARYIVAPVLAITVLGLGAAVACQARPTAPVAPVGSTPLAASGAMIRVHVTGAVHSPGVYELRVGDRVAEALRAAGGATDEADDTLINLAQRVHDEQRLDVPATVPAPPTTGAGSVSGTVPVAPTRPVAGGVSASVAGTTSAAGTDADLDALLSLPTNPEGGARVNVNQATVAQLERLPGIGAVSAKRVVTWRTDNGPIRSIADLRASGLTATVLRKALPYLSIG